MEKIDIMGIALANVTLQESIQEVERIIMKGIPSYLVFLNTTQFILCKENKRMFNYYNHADMVLVDGKNGVRLSKLAGRPVKEILFGTDYVYEISRLAAKKGYKIYILGGSTKEALETAVKSLMKDSPGLQVAGMYSPPYGFENDQAEIEKINMILRESHADILFVGLGSPKQDYFIEENKINYQIPLSIPIGSGIDIIGEKYKRAPRWVSMIGMEWFFRCLQEPGRLLKRYFYVIWKMMGYYRQFKKEKVKI